jgi:hypothetical protein
MTVTGGNGPGLKAAADAMQAMREWLGAHTLTAHFELGQEQIDMVVDEDGHDMYVDGEPVPIIGRRR